MKKLSLHIIFLLTTLFTGAQNAEISLNKTSFKIGEQTKLSIAFNNAKNEADVILPLFLIGDEIAKNIEVVSVSPIETNIVKGKTNYTQSISITGFLPGKYTIEPQIVLYNNDSIHSNKLDIEITTIAVDTTKDIKDIKPIYEENFEEESRLAFWQANWWWIVLLGLLLILGILYLILMKKKVVNKTKTKAKLPPHQFALKRLESIEKNELWQQDKIKEYYSSVTDVIRLYLEERYSIKANELTSNQIYLNLEKSAIDADSTKKLKDVFDLADLVKFAKAKPGKQENEKLMKEAKSFVHISKKLEDTTINIDNN